MRQGAVTRCGALSRDAGVQEGGKQGWVRESGARATSCLRHDFQAFLTPDGHLLHFDVDRCYDPRQTPRGQWTPDCLEGAFASIRCELMASMRASPPCAIIRSADALAMERAAQHIEHVIEHNQQTEKESREKRTEAANLAPLPPVPPKKAAAATRGAIEQ